MNSSIKFVGNEFWESGILLATEYNLIMSKDPFTISSEPKTVCFFSNSFLHYVRKLTLYITHKALYDHKKSHPKD